MLQPRKVGVSDLSEGDAARPAFGGDPLGVVQIRDVAIDELGGGNVGTALIKRSLGNPPPPRGPRSGRLIADQPCRSDPALDLPAGVAELRVVQRLTVLLADDEERRRSGEAGAISASA